MNIFQFIIYLGVVNIIFGFLWKWIFLIPISFLFALLRINKGIYLVKAFGAYLLVSLTALFTLGALTLRLLQGNYSTASTILFLLIGGFFLYMGFASNSYEARKHAALEYDYKLIESLKYDGLFMIGGLVLYVIILFAPIVAKNRLTQWLFYVIDWACNLPIIGWLLAFGGVIFLISIVWHGILACVLLIGSIVGNWKEPRRL